MAHLDPSQTRSASFTYDEVCFFLTRLTVSRLSTLRSVCEDSRIFMYAASVSAIVLSYSFRDAILRARDSLMRDRRSVRMRRSFWILFFSSSCADAKAGSAVSGRQR